MLKNASKYIMTVTLFILLAVIAGCSGDGGSTSGTTTIGTGGTGGTPGSGSGQISFSKTTLQLSETITVSATFTNADGTPASGVNVLFNTTLGVLNPVNGNAITGSNGTATLSLNAGTISGQGQVTATATVNGSQIVRSGLFTVVLPTLKLSAITLGQPTLSYGGSTSVTVTVLDANNLKYTAQPVTVVFSSVQSAGAKATITSPVTTVDGTAVATYTAATASGSDSITASISGSSVTAQVLINPLSANSITFVSATPTNIGLKGMGGIGVQETSTVVFKVLDTSGNAKEGQQVDFVLNTTVGGLALTAENASSDSNGFVSTIVKAGIIATPVRVTATLRLLPDSPIIATQSDQLVVSTGIPAQDGFSISIETLNPESWSTDGVIDKVTARLSDHFHNPVPDGTAVYFTTSAGSIQASCITSGGACSVNWTSQNPRPSNGRARILAYALGEEQFIDLNGNGVADLGEFVDTSEAFRDDNENAVNDASETYIDFNGNLSFNGPDGQYNGVLQGAAYVGAPKSKHIYSNSTIVMASSVAQIANSCGSSITVAKAGSTTCNITVKDVNNNTMPAGTTVAFKLTTLISGTTVTVTAIGSSTASFPLTMPAYDQYVFPNTAAAAGVVFPVNISNAATTTSASGVLEVTVTSPGKLVTKMNYNVN